MLMYIISSGRHHSVYHCRSRSLDDSAMGCYMQRITPFIKAVYKLKCCTPVPQALCIRRLSHPLHAELTTLRRRFAGHLQNMEGPGYDLNDLTPMLSRFMDASGNIDPSRAPPDMTASSQGSA